MNEVNQDGHMEAEGLNREQRMSALFTGMVINQSQLAVMLLGLTPHPATGKTVKDLDGARLFIDQLEMLEEKTKGNLDPQERKILRDQLTALRMAFVEASSTPTEAATHSQQGQEAPTKTARDATSPEPAHVDSGTPADSATQADSRKKFSKKY